MKRLQAFLIVLLCCLVATNAQEFNDSESEDIYIEYDYSGDIDQETQDDIDDFLKSLGGDEDGDNSYIGEEDYAYGDIDQDRVNLQPMDTAIIVIYSIITIVGLLANGIVFFVIFAGNEIGKD